MLRGQAGGDITPDEVLSKIVSIGFEFECGELVPVIISGNTISFSGERPIENNPYYNIIRSVDTAGTKQYSGAVKLNTLLNKNKTGIPDKIEYRGHKLVLPTVHDPHILQDLKHTEFHMTYFKIKSSDNILLGSLITATTAVIRLLEGEIDKASIYNILPGGNVEGPIDLVFDGKKLDTYMVSTMSGDYILTSNGDTPISIPNTMRWVPQCTIGVKLDDVPTVVEYISSNTRYPVDEIKERCVMHLGTPRYPIAFIRAMCEHEHSTRHTKFTYQIALRHSYRTILTYHNLVSSEDSEFDYTYKGVKQYPYKGIVLMEMRNFAQQLFYGEINNGKPRISGTLVEIREKARALKKESESE